jgi:hypothetical protein
MHDNQIQLASWANEAQSAVYDYATCFRPVFNGPDRLPSDVEFAIGQLQLRAALTSDSVLNLLIQLKLWDAEILLRTVVESSVKLAYIAVADLQEQHARALEFLILMPEMLRLKRHRRVEAFLASVPNPEADMWRAIRDIQLSAEEIQAISDRHPRSVRDNMERKWGFARITDELGKSGTEFQNLSAMMYAYGMGSHAVHQDGDAIMMMWEREQRRPEHVATVEFAHGARLISDVVTFAAIRARAAYKALTLDADPIAKVSERYEWLFEELHCAYDSFHALEYPSDGNNSE